MGRRRTVRKNNGHTRGSSLMYVVLLMTLLAVLSSGYMAISRYNMKAALKNRRYMEAQLSAKTIHRSFCEAVSSGESPAMNLIWQNFQEDCDRVREEFDAMMDEEEAEEGEDGELKAESFSSEEDTDTTQRKNFAGNGSCTMHWGTRNMWSAERDVQRIPAAQMMVRRMPLRQTVLLQTVT